ncbi:MAG: DUF262 domain-containing protein [Alphaproteobacteria bacterium]
MDSERNSVIEMFKPERQYCVPFYQRAYVWNQKDQWSRLWSDIQEKAEARLSGLPATPHFMGAVVLEPQDRKKLIGVEKVHIIDGQQRFTTIQFALAALSIMLRSWGHTDVLPVVEACLRNSDERNMRNKTAEAFKVWPTFYDRKAYTSAIHATDLDQLRLAFPEHFTQQRVLKKIGIRHPPALGAIWYFASQMDEWLLKTGTSGPESAEALASAILEDLVVISITLDEEDDAQVIFETLNGHGVELTATDLIRNYVFLRAEAEDADAEKLYQDQWCRYESDGWKQDERRGRLVRSRVEWFIQTVLQAEMRDDIDQGRIYAEYQRYARQANLSASAQLATLASYADAYQAMLDGDGNKPIGRFGKRYAAWDASTTYVLALAIAKSGASQEDQDTMLSMVGSYLVRRAICGLTNKNYNKVFLQLLKNLKGNPLTPASLRDAVAAFTGEATRFPKDEEFRSAILRGPMYPGRLDAPKMRSILVELENALRTERTEEPVVPALASLDIDHMMPQEWLAHWSLKDGTSATVQELSQAQTAKWIDEKKLTDRQKTLLAREAVIPTFGNLTLLHYGTNRAAKHHEFSVKRELFLQHSNLHLNREMLIGDKWDEDSILRRAEALGKHALRLWPEL